MKQVHVFEIGSCRGHKVDNHYVIDMSLLEQIFQETKCLNTHELESYFDLYSHPFDSNIVYTIIHNEFMDGSNQFPQLLDALNQNKGFRIESEEVNFLFGRTEKQAILVHKSNRWIE